MNMRFTTVNGKTATLLSRTAYKGHVIEKVSRQGLEFFTIDNKGMYWKLKDAKVTIDMNFCFSI